MHTMADKGKAVKPPLIGEEVIPESLRLHSTILTQKATKMVKYQKFQLKNAVSRAGAILFDIFNGDQKYTDVSSTILYIECQIRDGKSEMIPLKADAPAGGGPVPFHALGKVLPVNGMRWMSLLIFHGRMWPVGLQNPTHCLMLLSTDETSKAVKARVYISSHLFSQKNLTKTSGCHQKRNCSYL